MRLWYYQLNGNKLGPIDEASLKALVNIGQLQMTDYVWSEGMAEWQTVVSLPQFAKSPYAPPAVGIEFNTKKPVYYSASEQSSTYHTENELEERFLTWNSWQIWLLMIVTFGLFSFYLVPSWSRNIERITKKDQVPFGAILVLGFFTLTLAFVFFEMRFAYELSKQNRFDSRIIRNGGIFVQVLLLNLLSLFFAFYVANESLLLSMLCGISATWLIQLEINKYREFFDIDHQT
jgi:hypothetical protein